MFTFQVLHILKAHNEPLLNTPYGRDLLEVNEHLTIKWNTAGTGKHDGFIEGIIIDRPAKQIQIRRCLLRECTPAGHHSRLSCFMLKWMHVGGLRTKWTKKYWAKRSKEDGQLHILPPDTVTLT